jgi:AcrR family transcriptional regulator
LDWVVTQRVEANPDPGSSQWWAQRSARPSRPRQGGLSTRRIIDAAIEVLTESGLDGLTVRAVSERLGTSSGSLYRHIASREELLVLVGDDCLGAVRLGEHGFSWRAGIETLMRELRRVLLEHPLPPVTAIGHVGRGPNAIKLVDAALRVFLDAGMSERDATFATTAVLDFVFGAVSFQRGPKGRGVTGSMQHEYREAVLAIASDSELTGLRDAGRTFLAASADDVFFRGAEILLDGIALRLPRH